MTHITITAGSLPGLVRDHNEDMFLIDTDTYRNIYAKREFDIDIGDTLVMAVADGLGGHNAGEVASADAAHEFGAHIAALPSVFSPDELRADLEQWVRDEHAYLMGQGIENPEQQGMATTLVAALVYRGRTYLINCGDSRLYLYDADGLHQLSTDHSLYNVTHDPMDSHVVTNCIGAGAEPYIDFEDITDRLTEGCCLMLCSDGLSDMLTDDEMTRLLSDSDEAIHLINATYETAARDNVTAVVAKFEGIGHTNS